MKIVVIVSDREIPHDKMAEADLVIDLRGQNAHVVKDRDGEFYAVERV